MTIRKSAMQWFEQLEAKYASLSEGEQSSWLTTTPEGSCYMTIMNASWRENWEDIIEEVYREQFGA